MFAKKVHFGWGAIFCNFDYWWHSLIHHFPTCYICLLCKKVYRELNVNVSVTFLFMIIAQCSVIIILCLQVYWSLHIYALWEILRKDICRFLVFFIVVLYVFVGSFYLALRSGIRIEDNGNIRPDQVIHPLDTL